MPYSGWFRALLGGVVLFTAGCGSGKLPVYPVTGKVTGGTGSLKGVMINFSPLDEEKGLSASGAIEEDGSYKLTAGDGREGAAAGKYKIILALSGEAAMAAMMTASKKPGGGSSGGPKMPMMKGKPSPGGMGGSMSPSGSSSSGPPQMERPFPDKYASASTSPKEVEVKAGTNVLDIPL